MKRTTKLLALLLSLLMLVGLAACGSPTVSPSPSPTDTGAAQTTTPTASPSASPTDNATPSADDNTPITLTVMYNPSDISSDDFAQYTRDHPNITFNLIQDDPSKLMAMYAAGNAPDIMRMNAYSELPQFAVAKLLLPLDDYVAKSTVVSMSDAYPIANMFMWDSSTNTQGSGQLLGFIKDWSPDTQLWVNTKMFSDAGVTPPAAGTVLTYDQVAQYANQLMQKSGNTVSRYGFAEWVGEGNLSDTLLTWYRQTGASWWDASGVHLNNDAFAKVCQYWVDNAKTGAFESPLFPYSTWQGECLADNTSAMQQAGFWYAGMIVSQGMASAASPDDYVLLPSPVWNAGDKSVALDDSAVGYSISATCKHPQEAYDFLEWWMAGQLLDARMSTGWGLPAWQSKIALVPETTDFYKNAKASAINEITNSFNPDNTYDPYLPEATMESLFQTNLVQGVLMGNMSMSDALAAIEKGANDAIANQKQIYGIQ